MKEVHTINHIPICDKTARDTIQNHNHDEKYAAKNHVHDERYADIHHKHEEYTSKELVQNIVNNAIAAAPAPEIDLSNYALKTDVPTRVSQLQNNVYYVTIPELSNKEFQALKTNNKTIIGAINELYDMIIEIRDDVSDIPTSIPCTSIALTHSTVELDVGETLHPLAIVTPTNTTDFITWSSNNTSVATVQENGLITVVGEGTCTITATCGNQSAKCTITAPKSVICTGVTLNIKTLSLYPGQDAVDIVANVTPSNCTDEITWESSNSNVATVTNISEQKVGRISGIAVGTCTITVRCGNYSDTCTVTVTEEDVPVVDFEVKDLDLDNSITLILNNTDNTVTGYLYGIYTPNNSTDTITVTSSDSSTVSAQVTKQQQGEFVIQAIGYKQGQVSLTLSMGSITKTITVKVVSTSGDSSSSVPCESISIDESEITLSEGNNQTLTVTLYPVSTTDTLSWTSDDTSIATVNQNGVVTAVKAGTTFINVYCGDQSDFCKVIVNEQQTTVYCTGISIDSSYSGDVGESVYLNYNVTPSNCSQLVSWNSSNTGVATISGGRMTLKGKGTCTITATCGSYSDTCSVTVYDPYVCRDINIVTPNPYDTKVGNEATILAKPVPSTTTDTLSFSVANTSILTGTQVDHEFRMKELKAGTTTVTVRCGSITKTVTVNVSA